MTRVRSRIAATLSVAAFSLAAGGGAWAYFDVNSTSNSRSYTANTVKPASSPSAAPASGTSVGLSWSNPSAQIPSAVYTVTRTTDSLPVCSVASSTTSCTDDAAQPGTAYSYSIKAGLVGGTWESGVGTMTATTPNVFQVTAVGGAPLGNQVAGTSFNIQITAVKGAARTTDTAYTGEKIVFFTGPSDAPLTSAGKAVYGGAQTGSASLLFTAGIASTSVTLKKAESTAITATVGAGSTAVTGTSGSFTVAAGTRSNLIFSSGGTICGSGTFNTGTGHVWTSKVGSADATGNPVANGSAARSITISVTAGAGDLDSAPSPTVLSIAALATETGSSFSTTLRNGASKQATIRAVDNTSPGALVQVSCIVKH